MIEVARERRDPTHRPPLIGPLDPGQGRRVELVEAKAKLNAKVIGQLLCGAEMFKQSYGDGHELSFTACVAEPSDEALDWFCGERNIKVEVIDLPGPIDEVNDPADD